MTRIAHPKRGHKADLPDFVHFRTTINGTERDIYAKLFVSKVVADAANVNAPKPGTMPRFLHIGYELRTRPPGEIHEVAAADVTPAIQKVPPAASDTSQYALKINFANEPYLVLLVRRP
jgi:hypothetical protein